MPEYKCPRCGSETVDRGSESAWCNTCGNSEKLIDYPISEPYVAPQIDLRDKEKIRNSILLGGGVDKEYAGRLTNIYNSFKEVS